jgi:alpha-glucoside transport system permease protein
MNRVTKHKIRRWLRGFPVHILVIVIVVIWLTPSVGVFVNSFRTGPAMRASGWWTALMTPFDFTQWTLENYETVLTRQGLAQAFRNSLFIAIPATIIPALVAAFAAYAFAWMEFPFRRALFAVVVGLLVVPLQMTFVPVYRIYTQLGLNGTFLGIWLAHTGYGLPFAIYLLRNFMGSLPNELFESAWLDGASWFQGFTRIALPLSVPSLASLVIFQFLWVWNDLLVALIYLGGTRDVAPLTIVVAQLVDSLGARWYLLPAAAFVTMALPLLVFFTLQRFFVRGIMAGSVKG